MKERNRGSSSGGLWLFAPGKSGKERIRKIGALPPVLFNSHASKFVPQRKKKTVKKGEREDDAPRPQASFLALNEGKKKQERGQSLTSLSAILPREQSKKKKVRKEN